MKLRLNTLINPLRKYLLPALALLIALFFFYLSYNTPLAGDDWGYALNGMKGNPFITAFNFYLNWSGRFFSELYGFLLAPNKAVWNILNGLLFGAIFYLSIQISGLKRSLVGMLILVFLMFSVKDELRMETYTWIMGTTYVIPLVLSLLFLKINLDKAENHTKLTKTETVAGCTALFVLGLMMENIAVAMVVAILMMIAFYKKAYDHIPRQFWFFLAVSLISLIILRLSPGASERLVRDHPYWAGLSLFQQLFIRYPDFIRFSFIEHRYLILSLSLISLFKVLQSVFKREKTIKAAFPPLLIFGIAALSSMSLSLSQRLNLPILEMMTDSTSLFSLLFWPVFIVQFYYFIFTYFKQASALKLAYFVTLAGVANGVMMLSPIFGFRSSLYTVYFLFIVILLIFKDLDRVWLSRLILIPLLIMIVLLGRDLVYKYHLVSQVHQVRLGQIDYYRDHPEVKEAWLIRYPIFTIHSGDIEDDDIYHQDTFKEYYGLSPDLALKFYFPEEGY